MRAVKYMTKETIKKIAKEFPDRGAQALADEIGCSRARIYQVVESLRVKGVKIRKPSYRWKNDYALAIEELKTENPELF